MELGGSGGAGGSMVGGHVERGRLRSGLVQKRRMRVVVVRVESCHTRRRGRGGVCDGGVGPILADRRDAGKFETSNVNQRQRVLRICLD